jgi:hypothetical protein
MPYKMNRAIAAVPSARVVDRACGPARDAEPKNETRSGTTASGGASDDLCDLCRNLDFGSEYSVGVPSSGDSQQFWFLPDPDSSQPCCRFSTLIISSIDGRRRDELIRYVPPSTVPTDDSREIPNSGPKVHQIVYFRRGVIAAIRRFAPIPRAAAVFPRELSNLGTSNICLAKAWLDFCRARHEVTCSKVSGNALSGLKVIDCISRQVCLAKPGTSYLALSYVWGSQSEDVPLTLSGLTEMLPRTLEYAILVAKGLGIPYLWVDRYCIDQTNKQEKHHMVSNMDKVYAGADLTLIAAAGSDPHHGLPGISTTVRRNVDRRTIAGDGVLVHYPSLSKEFRNSVWASRGWTYQELLLSRRRLIFSDSQMFFHCCSQEFYEMFSLHSQHFTLSDKNDTASDISDAMQLGSIQIPDCCADHAPPLFESGTLGEGWPQPD